MKLSLFAQYFPRLHIANNIVTHIVNDETFANLSKPQRYMLGVECVLLAFYRKVQTIFFKRKFIERAGIPKDLI